MLLQKIQRTYVHMLPLYGHMADKLKGNTAVALHAHPYIAYCGCKELMQCPTYLDLALWLGARIINGIHNLNSANALLKCLLCNSYTGNVGICLHKYVHPLRYIHMCPCGMAFNECHTHSA